MSHYTLSWHDQQNEYQEIGEYADDAFEAVRHAREDVPYLQEHPFSCLLYTSPSPRDMRRSRMPSSA